MAIAIKTKTALFFLLFVFLVAFACKDDAGDIVTPEQTGPPWKFLGLKKLTVFRLVIAEPFLYACTGPDGLWRFDLQESDTGWVYVGLADTSLGRQGQYGAGVQDMAVSKKNEDWLLVITQPRVTTEFGVFKSLDGGKTWAPANNGLMYTSPGGYTGYFQPELLLQADNYIMAAGQGFNVFRTTNFGEFWENLRGSQSPGLLKVRALTFHDRFKNIIWLGGQTGFMEEFLARSSNTGATWVTWQSFDLPQIVERSGVASMALDPVDSNVVYVSLGSQVIKTIDNGKNWHILLEQGFAAMLVDPGKPSHLWAALGRELSETLDAGKTWNALEDIPVTSAIIEMVWDDKRQVIFIGTLDGVFRYRP